MPASNASSGQQRKPDTNRGQRCQVTGRAYNPSWPPLYLPCLDPMSEAAVVHPTFSCSGLSPVIPLPPHHLPTASVRALPISSLPSHPMPQPPAFSRKHLVPIASYECVILTRVRICSTRHALRLLDKRFQEFVSRVCSRLLDKRFHEFVSRVWSFVLPSDLYCSISLLLLIVLFYHGVTAMIYNTPGAVCQKCHPREKWLRRPQTLESNRRVRAQQNAVRRLAGLAACYMVYSDCCCCLTERHPKKPAYRPRAPSPEPNVPIPQNVSSSQSLLAFHRRRTPVLSQRA